jgi:hypothetical protein
MKHPLPSGLVFFLAASLVGSSCQPGPVIQNIPSPTPLPDPAATQGTAPGGSGGLENPAEATLTPVASSEITPAMAQPVEQPVIQIPLAGPAAAEETEFSGLAWYGEALVLLPQYPERMSGRGEPGVLFTLQESRILAFLDGESQGPLVPVELPLHSPDLEEIIPNYEGLEAIAITGDRVFLTIESGELGPMMGYLVAGAIAPDLMEIQLDASTLVSIPPQANLLNRGEEALVAAGDRLLSLFETNGARIVPDPVAHRIDLETYAVDTVAFPNVEYRITDATPADPDGRFWTLNTFFPGDIFIFPETDPIADQYGQGDTHSRELAVERLVQMQLGPEGITLAETPPIQIELLDSFQGRNWEGLAELPGRGFLLVTDRYPETILAFVPYP